MNPNSDGYVGGYPDESGGWSGVRKRENTVETVETRYLCPLI